MEPMPSNAYVLQSVQATDAKHQPRAQPLHRFAEHGWSMPTQITPIAHSVTNEWSGKPEPNYMQLAFATLQLARAAAAGPFITTGNS